MVRRLAEGFLGRVPVALAACPAGSRPGPVRARLGAEAGVIGAADLASSLAESR